MLIIMDDNVINMCELKFYSGEYDVDNKYYKTLMDRESLLQKEVSPKTVEHDILCFLRKRRSDGALFLC